MTAFPSHPDSVTPEWLNAALKGTAYAGLAPVQRLTWEPIGTGQVGDSVRLHLHYADEGPVGGGAPATLAAKFPAEDPASRGTAAMLGLYTKEVLFYTKVLPRLAVRAPDLITAGVSEDGTEFVLLFEDLGPARGGNQIAGCSLEDAREGIRQAAAFHAPSWENPAVLGIEGLATPEAVRAQIAALYPQAHAVFQERYADSLEPEYMGVCDAVAALPDPYYGRSERFQCLTHGDFRLDNLLFDIKGGTEPIAVLDWQTVTTGNAMTDIGYFLGTGIGDALRRAHEDELLDLYCAEMRARGVALTRAEIWDDYRIGALHGVTTAVFSAAFVERTERGDANFLSMARGACALALEHNSIAAIEEKA